MSLRSTIKFNTANSLRDKAIREGRCGHYDTAAICAMKAGRLFWEVGKLAEAESAWRRACDYCERRADQIFQRSQMKFHA